ncbi:hypothetical protein Tco_0818208 [Tanacetum coccineum]
MDSEAEIQRLKRAGQYVDEEPAKRQRVEEVSEPVQEQTTEEQKTDELSQEHLNQMILFYHVSTEKGQDIFMLVEKDYPLTRGLATLMLCNKLRVDQPLEMAYELLIKIYNIANRPRQGGLLGFKMILLVQDNTVIEALRI